MSGLDRPNFRLLTKDEAKRLFAKLLRDLPPEPTFEEERWVCIHADHGAHCTVWHKDGAAGSAASLPISGDLAARMDRRQEDFEAIWDSDDGASPIADIGAFCAEGRAIAQAVKEALPDWTVLYFDEGRYETYRADREGYFGPITYEVSLTAPLEKAWD